MDTYHLHISGQVQGVGFRPFVYRIAKKIGIKGWVNNSADGVHIEFNANPDEPQEFVNLIINQKPRQSKIEHYTLCKSTNHFFSDFQITNSGNQGLKEVRLSPDFGLCADCIKDLEQNGNRRQDYAFTTCTNCGPRYSIIKSLPYDRPNTEMDRFAMCEDCQAEYLNPEDRRFFSQTNSCHNCPIELELFHLGKKQQLPQKNIIISCSQSINRGEIVAIKGIGGFLLLCDATNDKAIRLLRQRKYRAHKPLALMYPSIGDIKKDLVCTDAEVGLLTSSPCPIVLLHFKKNIPEKLPIKNIAPHLDRVGVMLPSTPILYILQKSVGKPLVATSGNISGSPIIYSNEEAVSHISQFADFIVTHHRNISIPQDDSVVFYNHNLSKPILLRRSRGYAPSYFGNIPKGIPSGWLALGAQMKGSFALSVNNQIYVSQYLGNMESFDAQAEYKNTIKHLSSVLGFSLSHVFTDKHPYYFSHQFADQISETDNIPTSYIQHHKAHFAAVLQENNLLNSPDPVLGIIWDGTGFGDDGNIWGGEFFSYQDYEMKRGFHLKEFPIILADKMALEPRVSALVLTCGHENTFNLLREKFDNREWQLYNLAIAASKINTTSMGRLFDAVACILGLIDKSSFEGQAAMYLEAEARKNDFSADDIYPFSIENQFVQWKQIIDGILLDITKKKPTEQIAFKFHLTLVEIIRKVALKSGINKLAFSGGVFQNNLLVDLIAENLGQDFDLYFHKELSPNDENISFGQLISGYIRIKKNQTRTKKTVLQEV